MQELFALHDRKGPERCGVILDDGSIVELDNIHPTPLLGFAMPVEALEASNVVATWHTHPVTGPNLSIADYRAFVSQPRLRHYVVAETEIWCYGVAGDILSRHDDYHSTRPLGGALPPGNQGPG